MVGFMHDCCDGVRVQCEGVVWGCSVGCSVRV